jgi:hypothetical protein
LSVRSQSSSSSLNIYSSHANGSDGSFEISNDNSENKPVLTLQTNDYSNITINTNSNSSCEDNFSYYQNSNFDFPPYQQINQYNNQYNGNSQFCYNTNPYNYNQEMNLHHQNQPDVNHFWDQRMSMTIPLPKQQYYPTVHSSTGYCTNEQLELSPTSSSVSSESYNQTDNIKDENVYENQLLESTTKPIFQPYY